MSHFLNSKAVDPTECADLLFGVGSATSAGPTLPAGSIHPSPETLEKDRYVFSYIIQLLPFASVLLAILFLLLSALLGNA